MELSEAILHYQGRTIRHKKEGYYLEIESVHKLGKWSGGSIECLLRDPIYKTVRQGKPTLISIDRLELEFDLCHSPCLSPVDVRLPLAHIKYPNK